MARIGVVCAGQVAGSLAMQMHVRQCTACALRRAPCRPGRPPVMTVRAYQRETTRQNYNSVTPGGDTHVQSSPATVQSRQQKTRFDRRRHHRTLVHHITIAVDLAAASSSPPWRHNHTQWQQPTSHPTSPSPALPSRSTCRATQHPPEAQAPRQPAASAAVRTRLARRRPTHPKLHRSHQPWLLPPLRHRTARAVDSRPSQRQI